MWAVAEACWHPWDVGKRALSRREHPGAVEWAWGPQVAETRVCSSRGAGVEVRGFSPGSSRIPCCEMLGELVFERGAVSRRTSETKRGCI